MTVDKSQPYQGSASQIPASVSAANNAPRVREQAPVKREAPRKEAQAPEPRESSEAEVAPKVESDGSARTASSNYLDYRLSSDYELIISVKNRQTNEEVRQIPSKESRAVQRAIKVQVDKLVDKKV